MYALYRPQPTNRKIYVYDTDVKPVGMISEYESLQMERNHFGIGPFELLLPEMAKDATTLKKDCLISLGQSGARAGIVRKVETDQDRTTGLRTGMAKVSGYMLKGAARWRTIVAPTQDEDPGALGWDRVFGKAEEIYRHYMNRHIVAPTDPNRKLPGIILDALANPPRGIESPWQSKQGEKLPDVLEEIGNWTDMGWDIRLDIQNKRGVFVCIPGRDFTLGNSEGNSPVLFSGRMLNLQSVRYVLDLLEFTNSPYFAGAGTDEQQLVMAAYFNDDGTRTDEPKTGWDRLEDWINVGAAETPDVLLMEGSQRYADSRRFIQGLEAQVLSTGPFKYGIDWDVGDRVTTVVDVLGQRLRLDTRIIMVREIYERSAVGIDVVVGANELTLRDRLNVLRKEGQNGSTRT